MPARSAAKTAQLIPSGRGGARKGAGHPRNPPGVPVSQVEIDRVAATGTTAAAMAHAHAARVVATLLHLSETGGSDIARVAAARALANLLKDFKPAVPKSAASIEWDELLGEAGQ